MSRDPGTPEERPLRVLVVDDEPVAREGLEEMLAARPDVRVVGTAASGRGAVAKIRDLRPDLVFLDVRMPDLDGFQVLRSLDEEASSPALPAVVFVTAFDEFAVRAFEVRALDYLLKPFGDRRLAETLRRARREIRRGRAVRLDEGIAAVSRSGARSGVREEEEEAEPEEAGGRGRGGHRDRLERFTVKRGRRRLVVAAEDVDWIEGAGDYARLHVGDRSYLVRRTLRDLSTSLDPSRFVRIHRSSIVNLDRVREYRPLSHGDYTLHLQDGTRLRVSRTRRERFLEALRRG